MALAWKTNSTQPNVEACATPNADRWADGGMMMVTPDGAVTMPVRPQTG